MKRYVYARHSNSKLLRQQWAPTEDEYKVISTDGAWKCVQPLTHKACVYFGRLGGVRAHWDLCVEDTDRWFNKYAPIYIFYNESDPNEKYAYAPEYDMLYDIEDYKVDPADFVSEHPNFAYLFE